MRSDRKQERFFWVFVVTALLNVLIGSLSPWGVEVIFLLFSLIMLIGCAHWLEVPWIVRHLERWFAQALGENQPKEGETE